VALCISESSMRLQGQKIGVGGAEYMRAAGVAASGGAAAAVEVSQLVGVEETDLPCGDFMDDGPVVPHGATQADEDGALAVDFEKAGHFGPEFIERGIGQVFVRHAAVGNQVTDHMAKNAADSDQSDAFGEHPAQVTGLFQVFEDAPEQFFGLGVTDGRDDPGGVDDAVNGAQTVQPALLIGFQHGSSPAEDAMGRRSAARFTSRLRKPP